MLGVKELKSQLENAGYSVWLDQQDIAGGSDWHCVIGEAVKSCRALIALINSKYLSSVHCKNELYMANSCSKPLLRGLSSAGFSCPTLNLWFWLFLASEGHMVLAHVHFF